MANKSPKTDHLSSHQFQSGDRELGKVVGTRYPIEFEAVLLQMSSSDRAIYIRNAIEAKLIADGLLPDGAV